jgi:ketosteroid isomerase-like protein
VTAHVPGDPVDVREVEDVNRAMYVAIEDGDLDAMAALWIGDDEGDPGVCVHPGWAPVHGRARILRSWALVMAGTPYIQFFLTDVRTRVLGDVAVVSCAENILTAVSTEDGASHDPSEGFAGGQVVATNVFRRTATGWRAVVHHASPVLARDDADLPGASPGGGA